MDSHSTVSHDYDDIIHLVRPSPKTHPRMPVEARAAQFCPFAGLAGYEGAIREASRLTDERIEPDDAEKLLISDKLQLVLDSMEARPEITLTFFQPDKRKEGGAYIGITGIIKKVKIHERVLLMEGGASIPMDDVIAIDGALFKEIER